jgi:hypothetical protein
MESRHSHVSLPEMCSIRVKATAATNHDFMTKQCAHEYGKWCSEELLEFIYTNIDWTLQQHDFATIIDDTVTWTIGRIKIWTKTMEFVFGGPDAYGEVRASLGEELIYVIENGLVKGR